MKEIYTIRKTINTPDNRILSICDVLVNDDLSKIVVKSYPLDIHGVVDPDEAFSESILGAHSSLKFRDAIIINNTGKNSDYQILICGLDKNRIFHDPNVLEICILNSQLQIIHAQHRYVHEHIQTRYMLSGNFITEGSMFSVEFVNAQGDANRHRFQR